MTEEQKQARREYYYSKSIKELVEMLIEAEDELAEAKSYRTRLMKIRNLALQPEERNKPGRPKKEKLD